MSLETPAASERSERNRSLIWWLGPVLYTLTFLALAGILAPLFHLLIEPLDANPFRRYTDRALMISALLCLIPYLRAYWGQLGLGWQQGSGRLLLLGLGIALGSILLINAIHLGLGTRTVQSGWGLEVLPKALLAAVLVGPLEELLFRGVMLHALRQRMGLIAGFVLTVWLYAWVHFFKAPASFQPDPVHWYSGFEAVGLALGNMMEGSIFTGARFWILILVGVILGLAYLKTGSLWLSIGLHAGWIFGIQWSSRATDTLRDTPSWLGSADVLTGDLTFGVLALLALLLWLLPWPNASCAPGSER